MWVHPREGCGLKALAEAGGSFPNWFIPRKGGRIKVRSSWAQMTAIPVHPREGVWIKAIQISFFMTLMIGSPAARGRRLKLLTSSVV